MIYCCGVTTHLMRAKASRLSISSSETVQLRRAHERAEPITSVKTSTTWTGKDPTHSVPRAGSTADSAHCRLSSLTPSLGSPGSPKSTEQNQPSQTSPYFLYYFSEFSFCLVPAVYIFRARANTYVEAIRIDRSYPRRRDPYFVPTQLGSIFKHNGPTAHQPSRSLLGV